MFFGVRSWSGVLVVLVGFVVTAGLLGWPDSRFAVWFHRVAPFLLPVGLLVGVALWTFRQENGR
jgi:hypothetical protein